MGAGVLSIRSGCLFLFVLARKIAVHVPTNIAAIIRILSLSFIHVVMSICFHFLWSIIQQKEQYRHCHPVDPFHYFHHCNLTWCFNWKFSYLIDLFKILIRKIDGFNKKVQNWKTVFFIMCRSIIYWVLLMNQSLIHSFYSVPKSCNEI